MSSRVNHQRRLQTRRVRPGSRDPITHNAEVRERKRRRQFMESMRQFHIASSQAARHLNVFRRATHRSVVILHDEGLRARSELPPERSQEDRRAAAHALRDLGRELEGDTDA